jgi:hypothetical protein
MRCAEARPRPGPAPNRLDRKIQSEDAASLSLRWSVGPQSALTGKVYCTKGQSAPHQGSIHSQPSAGHDAARSEQARKLRSGELSATFPGPWDSVSWMRFFTISVAKAPTGWGRAGEAVGQLPGELSNGRRPHFFVPIGGAASPQDLRYPSGASRNLTPGPSINSTTESLKPSVNSNSVNQFPTHRERCDANP